MLDNLMELEGDPPEHIEYLTLLMKGSVDALDRIYKTLRGSPSAESIQVLYEIFFREDDEVRERLRKLAMDPHCYTQLMLGIDMKTRRGFIRSMREYRRKRRELLLKINARCIELAGVLATAAEILEAATHPDTPRSGEAQVIRFPKFSGAS